MDSSSDISLDVSPRMYTSNGTVSCAAIEKWAVYSKANVPLARSVDWIWKPPVESAFIMWTAMKPAESPVLASE